MVAPVQGTIGKSSQAPATQDYLNELTNFYNKKENEGVESEFVAPDGSKYKIQDASYLSTVRSNVNTGKFDAKAEENNKTVSKDADTSVGSYAAEKKAAANKKDNNVTSPETAKSEGGHSISSGRGAVSKGESKKTSSAAEISGISAEIANVDAQVAKTKAETVSNQEATKETFKKMDQDNAKITKMSKEIVTKTEAKFQKAVKARHAKAEDAAENAAQASEDDSTQQSGSKMGFEGKLMTTASASTGNGGGNNAAMDKAWEDTMNGKLTSQSKLIQTEVPKLENVKEAGAKAAQPGLDQAANSDTAAQAARDNRSTASDNGTNTNRVNGILIGSSVVSTGIGIFTAVIGQGMIDVGTPMAANVEVPAVAAAGAAMVSSGGQMFWSGLGATAVGVAGIIGGSLKADADVSATRAQCRAFDRSADASVKMADSQRTQSMVARRNAIVQAQAENVKIIKATQALNKASQEMSTGLSSSSLSAINTDGMDKDQLETVKQDRYNQIMAHEQQHAAIIGGSPVIETDANGVAIGGYVQIDVPSLDESDLEGTIEKAQKVVDAALAPSDPSSQDQSIASQAKDVLSKAQDMLAEKTEKAKNEEDKKPEEKKEEVKEEPKAEVKEDKNEAKKAA